MGKEKQGPDFARYSNLPLFIGIAKKNYALFTTALAELKELKKRTCHSEDDASLLLREMSGPEDIVAESGVLVIAFAAIALEAHIYDYAARNFTKGFVDNYLDKLDLKSKWVIYPRLKTGKPVPVDDNAFARLGKLISARNKFVHEKSSEITPESLERIDEREKEFEADVHNAMDALKELSTLATRIDADDPWLAENISLVSGWERIHERDSKVKTSAEPKKLEDNA